MKNQKKIYPVMQCCESGYDPVGSETSSRIRSEFEVRLIDNFSMKMLNLKLLIPFYQKNCPKKLIQYQVIICYLTHLQDGNTKIIFMLRKL